MIQFNLLPDVKQEYIKARRSKRLVIMGSVVVSAVSLAIMIVLFIGTNVLQREHMNNLAEDIERDSEQLENIEDLDKILTVQNQLGALDELHDQKPATARLGNYLSQLVPVNATITELTIDFTDNSMTYVGSASSLGAVNQFVDTLKFTDYSSGDVEARAFSSVVLTEFGRNDENDEAEQDPVTYQIDLNFDPVIFDITQSVTLVVPNTVTTRSAVESPSSPFEQAENQSEGE